MTCGIEILSTIALSNLYILVRTLSLNIITFIVAFPFSNCSSAKILARRYCNIPTVLHAYTDSEDVLEQSRILSSQSHSQLCSVCSATESSAGSANHHRFQESAKCSVRQVLECWFGSFPRILPRPTLYRLYRLWADSQFFSRTEAAAFYSHLRVSQKLPKHPGILGMLSFQVSNVDF